jgi:hypothetical protein
MPGIYYVYLKVTDTTSNVAQSDTARIVVTPTPVGGYSVAFTETRALAPAGQWLIYFGIVAFFGAMLSLKKRTRKPKC